VENQSLKPSWNKYCDTSRQKLLEDVFLPETISERHLLDLPQPVEMARVCLASTSNSEANPKSFYHLQKKNKSLNGEEVSTLEYRNPNPRERLFGTMSKRNIPVNSGSINNKAEKNVF
jgi:hypothetical protein